MTACSTFFIHLLALCFVMAQTNEVTEITIFCISNLKATSAAKSIVGGEWLAIQEINNNSNLLSNYTLNLQIFDSKSDRQEALLHALNVTNHKNTMNKTYFPIVLGAPWSSLSISTAPVLAAFNMGQISASSTSISLSDTSAYPYFYRTPPSDAVQAEGIILLCNTFNWTSIAVIYVNDVYGLYLSLEIQSLATKYHIDVTSIAVSESEHITYHYAAEQIKDLQIFIVVVIIHDNYMVNLFNTFKSEGIIGYPYFYIGCDGWLEESIIAKYNVTEITAGSIGTVPWQSSSLSLDEYDVHLRGIVNESIVKHDNVLKTWRYRYNNGDAENLRLEIPGNYMVYGYDAMYTLAYAMQEIEENEELYGGNVWELIQEGESRELIGILNDIIVNKTDFIGTSGRVVFDDVGDRLNGLYSLGNVLENGHIDYFGYLYGNEDGSVTFKLNVSKIKWPKYFTEKEMIPRSDVLLHEEMITLPKSALLVTFVVSLLSILVVICCIFISIWYHKSGIMKAGSWRLNIVMCFGAISFYIRVMLYGVDESLYILNIICNLRIWIATISYTLLFQPLFVKTYRLSQIFNKILNKKIISDKRLFVLIGVCLLIDIILLSILTLLHPLERQYLSGNIEQIDEIQKIQYMYGSCSDEWYFYGLIIFWKLCQSLWGIHVALSVSRINHNGGIFNKLTQFDETGTQLFSILFTFVIICIASPIFVFGIWIKNILISYLSVVIPILSIGNVVVSSNLFPRIYAVITGNEERFKKSPSEQMECKIRRELHRLETEKSKQLIPSSTQQATLSRVCSVGGSKKMGHTFTTLSVHDEEHQESSEETVAMEKILSTAIYGLHVE